MKKTSILFVLAIAAAFGLQSCQKEKVTKTDSKQTSTQVFNKTNVAITKVQRIVNSALSPMGFNLPMMRTAGDPFDSLCATVSIDSSSSPFVATIDFGSGCYQPDGSFIAGVLIVKSPNLNGGPEQSGTTITFEFQNLVIDTTRINGGFELKNLGINGSGNVYGKYDLIAFIESLSSPSSYNVTLHYDLEIVNSLHQFDGFITTVDNLGITTNHVVEEILVQGEAQGCENVFTDGLVKVSVTGDPDYFIDYGNGRCDKDAMEIRGGVSTPITLD